MPSILNDDDKQNVKRQVPKASNKIHAVAVAKLYIAYPNHNKWQYTGLQGAVVLANDLVGNTFWIKMVDVSPSNRGVVWDQEIYDTFQYNQDRTFFHTFELEDCLAGLSFADEKEAKQFKKKMDEREKNAHKNTRNKPFGSGSGTNKDYSAASAGAGGSTRHRFGFSSLLPGHRHSQATQAPAQSIIPPRDVTIGHTAPARSTPSHNLDMSDPAVQEVLNQLLSMGITEDQLEEHAGFIQTYLEQHKATAAAEEERKARAPPPPPPVAAQMSPQTTGGSGSNSRRGPPPAPPQPRRGAAPARPPSPSPSPPRAPSPPRPMFRAPPPIADAGKYANVPAAPARARASSSVAPPPPPRAPTKTPADEPSSSRFGVPPPFAGNRIPSGPPPTPARGPVPPPPPARNNVAGAGVPMPPPLPPKTSNSAAPLPPPLPPSSARPVPPPPGAGGLPPPPPPLPPMSSG
ncbi:WH1-domain-containing protein, partial [Aureobasidium melanogenum]